MWLEEAGEEEMIELEDALGRGGVRERCSTDEGVSTMERTEEGAVETRGGRLRSVGSKDAMC